jgi:hypothetical protein
MAAKGLAKRQYLLRGLPGYGQAGTGVDQAPLCHCLRGEREG